MGGRVTVLDREGQVVASLGANERTAEIKTNKVPPESWRPEVFYAPHGITYDAAGNLLLTEWNSWGRVVRLQREGARTVR